MTLFGLFEGVRPNFAQMSRMLTSSADPIIVLSLLEIYVVLCLLATLVFPKHRK
jgi:hypothetical protein